jgi:hypothetical protein
MQQVGKSPSNPVNSGGSSSGGGGMSKMKLGLIILAPLAAALVIVTQFILPNYVNKADDSKNIQGIVSDMTKIKTDTAASIASFQAVINAVPSTVSSQVTASVNQATSSMNAQITSMQTQVTNMAAAVTASTNKLANVDTLTAKLAADEVIIEKLTANATAVGGQIATMQGQIAVLQTQIVANQSLSYLSVSGTSTNINFPIPAIMVINTGTTTVDLTSIGVMLTMTPPAGMSLSSNFVLSSSSGLVSGTYVLRATLGQLGGTTIAPNSTISISPNITLNSSLATGYTANSTSPWNAVWSKQ